MMRKDIQRFIEELAQGEKYSRATGRAYEYELQRFVDFIGDCAPEKVKDADVRMYVMKLAKSSKPAAQRRALASLATFFRWLVLTKRIKDDPLRTIERPLTERRRPRCLDADDLNELVGAVAEVAFPPRKARDLALLSLMLNAGLRLSELAHLDRTDVDLNAGIVIVGHGPKRREIPLNADLRRALTDHLSQAPVQVPAQVPAQMLDTEGAPLFTNSKGGRLSKDGIYYLVRRYMRAAGIVVDETGKASPRTLRHTFCAQLLAKGANIAVVQELAGHASLASTSVYLDVSIPDKRSAVALLGS